MNKTVPCNFVIYINHEADAFMAKKERNCEHYLQIYSFRFYYIYVLSRTKCQKFHHPVIQMINYLLQKYH